MRSETWPQDSQSDEIVIVSHQDPIQAARLALTHRTLADLQKDKPEHGEVFTFEIGVPWTLRERWAPPGLPGAEPGPPRQLEAGDQRPVCLKGKLGKIIQTEPPNVGRIIARRQLTAN